MKQHAGWMRSAVISAAATGFCSMTAVAQTVNHYSADVPPQRSVEVPLPTVHAGPLTIEVGGMDGSSTVGLSTVLRVHVLLLATGGELPRKETNTFSVCPNTGSNKKSGGAGGTSVVTPLIPTPPPPQTFCSHLTTSIAPAEAVPGRVWALVIRNLGTSLTNRVHAGIMVTQ